MRHYLAIDGVWERKKAGFVPRIPVGSEETVLSRMSAWLDRQRQRVYLAELDERLLQDIGVGKKAADIEARRWS